jgi:hypothetical protein
MVKPKAKANAIGFLRQQIETRASSRTSGKGLSDWATSWAGRVRRRRLIMEIEERIDQSCENRGNQGQIR